MLAVCLAAIVEAPTVRRHRRTALVVGAVCIAWSVWLMLKYWTGVIPIDGTRWAYFTRTFWELSR